MATCPNCGGYAHSEHRCRGLWRIRFLLTLDLAVSAIVGCGVVGAAFLFLDGHVAPTTLVIGGLIAVIVRWAVIAGPPPHFRSGT